MFKIHKKIEYALAALKYMQEKPKGHLTTAKEICRAYKIPFDPTSRVLQIMTQEGILEAVQGAYGGYRLVMNLNKVTVLDLSRMITGAIAITDCCTEEQCCGRMANCAIKGPMAKLNAKLLRVFRDVKVSEMV